jgi:hypothetical protein
MNFASLSLDLPRFIQRMRTSKNSRKYCHVDYQGPPGNPWPAFPDGSNQRPPAPAPVAVRCRSSRHDRHGRPIRDPWRRSEGGSHVRLASDTCAWPHFHFHFHFRPHLFIPLRSQIKAAAFTPCLASPRDSIDQVPPPFPVPRLDR